MIRHRALSAEEEAYSGISELEALERNLAPWLKAKAELLLHLSEGRKVLEVGCGIGSLTQFFSARGYEVLASDISPVCIEAASRKHLRAATFMCADISQMDPWRGLSERFDTVVMSDVLEHIQDAASALKNVKRVLKKNGVLVITVPAHNLLYTDLDRKIGHVRRYSIGELAKQLDDSGMIVEQTRQWNFPGMVGWLLAFKLLRRKVSLVRGGALTRFYGWWLQLERRQDFGLGLTIVAKARKP